MSYKIYFAYSDTLFLSINGHKMFSYDRSTLSNTVCLFTISYSPAASCVSCVCEEVTYILAPMGGWGVFRHNHMFWGNFTLILINSNV